MIGFTGFTSIEVSVAVIELVPPPPPPPLQFITNKEIRIKRNSLLNFINTDPFLYKSRHVGAALQISHMSPFFHNNIL